MILDELIVPAAPQANNRGRYAPTAKKARPLAPAEVIQWLEDLELGGKTVKGIRIEGPGDPLAAPSVLFDLLAQLTESRPGCRVSLTTLGLGAASLAGDLKKAGIDQITLLVDSVETVVAEKIYAWIRPGRKTLALPLATELLVKEQAEAVQALAGVGLDICIRTTVYPGINDNHISRISKKMAGLGAGAMELVPYRHEEGEEELLLDECDDQSLRVLEQQIAADLEVKSGPGDRSIPPPLVEPPTAGQLLPGPTEERPNVAVASSNGMDIDLHLGQATNMLIYGPREDGLACLLESRPTPQAGTGDNRWQALARACLGDCFALLAANAGENPRKVLADEGIKVLLMEDNIEGTVDVLYGGGKKKKCKK